VATSAVSVEQTHNRGGGAVHPLADLQELRAFTSGHGVDLHCDGARIWNAAVASGTPLASYGAVFDTLSVCLSKGLGAPVGLAGGHRRRARRGGPGAAQAARRGHAAGGRARRRRFVGAGAPRRAAGRRPRPRPRPRRRRRGRPRRVSSTPSLVETNLVPLDLSGAPLDAPQLAAAARDEGVLLSVLGPRRARLVTHLDVDDAGAARAGEVVARLLSA
jgi:threonine aldolase